MTKFERHDTEPNPPTHRRIDSPRADTDPALPPVFTRQLDDWSDDTMPQAGHSEFDPEDTDVDR